MDRSIFPVRAGALPGERFDLGEVAEDVRRLRSLPGLAERVQISLVHRPGAQRPYEDGAGSLLSEDRRRLLARETEFTEFHVDWRGSALHRAHNMMEQASGFRLGRFRVLILKPRRCYSIHHDPEIRLHLPVITNDQSFLLFGDGPPVHLPSDGRAYWVDTRHAHSAMNGHGSEERIHLVASVLEDRAGAFDEFVSRAASRGRGGFTATVG